MTPASATVKFGRYTATLAPADVAWTRRKLPDILKPGDIVYVKILALSADGKARVSLEQDSGAQGALVAIDNATGEIKAMVGGRDFNLSKFNRATQALRQVGSSFKPYVYTAAIDRGATPDDTILDAPVTFPMPSGPAYTPHNYDEKFEGTITLRRALAQSRNIPALKLADNVGIKTVIDYAHRFGITSNIPPYLPVALGAAEITLMEQTSAFSVFPNDGVRITPRYITKVTDYEGRMLEENFPDVKDVISARTARTMTAMLREVVLHGTGIAASTLEISAGGKDRHHQRFHRRLVRRLLALDHLRRLGRLRREEIPGSKRDRRPRRITHLDGFHEGRAGRKRSGRVPAATRLAAKRDAASGGHARHRACRG